MIDARGFFATFKIHDGGNYVFFSVLLDNDLIISYCVTTALFK